ncbi:aromatic prenyltransferase [Nemania sp. NC0429]|nr:aromatic prenyltransferase [Nemania sp. NC0429]
MASTPFDIVNSGVSTHQKGDSSFWWHALGKSFASLLKSSSYDESDQLLFLLWFQQSVATSLGPTPIGGKAHYPSTFVFDGSPIEFSLNWKEKSPKRTVRFTIEPCSPQAGTVADPLNDNAAKDLLASISKEMPGTDLSLFDLFWSETRVPQQYAAQVSSKIPPGQPRHRAMVAFDLERGGGILPKAYFNPQLKAMSAGTTPLSVVSSAIRQCNGPGRSYDACVDAFRDYLESFGPDDAPLEIPIFSNDCTAVSSSTRIKVYLVTSSSTLARVKDLFTLGGRISGPNITSGLELVTKFWCHIFNLDPSDPHVADKVVDDAVGPCIWGFEMRPNTEGQTNASPEIEAKIYVLGSWLGKTDAQVCKTLSTWFHDHGHPDFAEQYQADLEAAFPKHDFNTPDKLIHTWISLTWTKKAGCYMTMYYSPRLPDLYYSQL